MKPEVFSGGFLFRYVRFDTSPCVFFGHPLYFTALCCLSTKGVTTILEKAVDFWLRWTTMSNSNGLIKDSITPKLNRNNKLLESRKSNSNLLKNNPLSSNNTPPSLHYIATSRASKNSSRTAKTHTNYRQVKAWSISIINL